MKKKNTGDVLDLFQNLQDIMKNKPSPERMLEEIRMMNFKVRPLQGDITSLVMTNRNFLETLWNLGKLDEFFQKKYRTISSQQKNVFFRLFDDLHRQFQDQLNKYNLKRERVGHQSSVLEIEIFREKTSKRNIN